MSQTMLSRIIANLPLLLLLIGVLVVAPLFFVPGIGVPFVKFSVLSISVALSLVVYTIFLLRDGFVALPKTRVWIGIGAVLCMTLLSGLFSPVSEVSFLGAGGEIGTVFATLVFIILFTLALLTIRSRDHILYMYLGLSGAGLILAIHYLVNLVALHMGSTIFSLAFFTNTTVNSIGQWNEFGVFYGLIAILSLLMLLLGPKARPLSILSMVFLVTSLVMIAIVDFAFVWWAVGIFSLLLFVYMISFGRAAQKKKNTAPYHIPFIPLIIVLVAAVFLLPGNLGGYIADRIAVSHVEVRPSVEATIHITERAWQEGWKETIIGIGPNRFSSAWSLYKPVEVNQTSAWDTHFHEGVGSIPSFLVTLGIGGVLAWILFLSLFVFEGVRGIIRVSMRESARLGIVISFIAAVYLWVTALIYIPNVFLFGLAFLFSGACIGLLVREEVISIKKFSFVEDPRIGFVSVLAGVVLLLGGVVAVYGITLRSVSGIMFRDGVASFKKGDSDSAITYMVSAIRMYEHDSYYRALTQGHLARLETISIDEVGRETALAQFREVLGSAIISAETALAYDDTNYMNELALASVYAKAAFYDIEGAEKQAIAAYDRAALLNPTSPEISYLKARLAIASDDLNAARTFLAESIGKKNNYTTAIFLLAQIEEAEGNIDEAIYLAETASSLAPLDAGLYFQLGLLKYKEEDYAGAKNAFIRAVALLPSYNNALYFLGLSHDKLNEKENAVLVFEELAVRFPENDDIVVILDRLKQGLIAVPETTEEAPEDADEPPIDESL